MNDLDEIPLPALYKRAQEYLIKNPTLNSAEERSHTQKIVLGWLQRCEELVQKLGIFSPNEDAEDIATGDLKYLLVAAYLGDIQSSPQELDPTLRKAVLENAITCFSRFLRLCEQYSLVPVEAHTIDLTDAQTRRQLKVQRYQKEKLIRAKLEQLAPSPWRASAVDDDNASTDESEDSEREVWLLKVELAVLEAAENMSHIKQELEILAHATNIPAEERNKPLAPPPADLIGELNKAAANLGRQRQQIAADVFRPSHRLPTRSLREQADREVADALQRSEQEKQAVKLRAELEADEDYVLQKQRNWDDWKDDHERGAGNDRLRPTA